MHFTRRDILKLSGAPIGCALLSILGCSPPPRAYRFFSQEEARTVIAICEQIIPADEDPGATDAGVIHFIDKQLVSYYAGDQEMYRNGIATLNHSCMTLHKKRFESLPFSEQEAFLKQLQRGKIDKKTWGDIPQIKFFNMLVNHTMQGFYGSPVHGGNKDYVSYSMLDFEYPLVIGQNRYQGKTS